MGSAAHVLVVGEEPEPLLDRATSRLRALEATWTRFSPESELSQLNDARGRPCIVSADTYRLVETAVHAWRLTGGRYDPTLLLTLTGLGYDRTFATIGHPTLRPAVRQPEQDARSVGSIDLAPGLLSVTLPPGLALDPGGIGKGLAADMVAEELLAAGAAGVMINVGGDVRVAGTPPAGGTGWPIAVADPFDPERELLRLQIPDGAVATSSRLQRRWTTDAGQAIHHLLDPTTGRPIDNDIAAVTVVAGSGWWAEALTKAVFTADAATGLDRLVEASGVIVDSDGNRHATPDLAAVLR